MRLVFSVSDGAGSGERGAVERQKAIHHRGTENAEITEEPWAAAERGKAIHHMGGHGAEGKQEAGEGGGVRGEG